MSVSFRFIHAADLHVDSPFRGLAEAPSYVQNALMSSTFEAVHNLVQTAITAEVDFVVIAGDLYDSADRSLRAQLALQREWQKLHTHGVQLFVIHGNHDHLAGNRANLNWPDSVVTFGSERMESMPAYRKDGQLAAYIYGMSYGARAVTHNLAASYKPNSEGLYQIALLHGNVDGSAEHDPYAPCTLSELVGAGFDYWALGHIHTRSILHTYPHVAYAGNTQGRHAREIGAKGCYIVDVSDSKETIMTFAPLDVVRWEIVNVNIEGLSTEQALYDAVELAIKETQLASDGRPIMLKLHLSGRGLLHRSLLDAIFLQEFMEGMRVQFGDHNWQSVSEGTNWCWIYAIEASTGTELDLDVLANEDSFTGELVRGSILLEVDEEARIELLEEAMAPLMTNARLRKFIREQMEEDSLELLQQARELAAALLVDESELLSGRESGIQRGGHTT
ncbi:exonuclease SbcCD subunit D [Paenibacillus baekrokdamisoli]|uniref:Exonuclease SbcCD subunit D n=1 Tax=Paenibacillus baekrokdamisoli TaxID=1712516 RepID=A0A3G9IM09_9BACL|nr:DNA repair exonuclease [Paenibacillus baekrokdamisoli]MBB3067447.1 DNA repair exonuclease SbcCD nuclease subunit [Paenibacillus baekrokdamisoli]BBH19366.1 exonuclease SbcCD subunit D [Paenibacillus baekrokdamisoli]